MPSYLRNEVVLVRYLFSDLSGSKVRPAVVVNAPHASQDVFIVPLTSKTSRLLTGEFMLGDGGAAGLNVSSAIKRGLYTLRQDLIVKTVGSLSGGDAKKLESSLRGWLGLT
jgi:mRNA interferase MazF